MLVKIVDGFYGLSVNGVIRAMSPKDPPFAVPDAEAHRIIGMGIAKAADEGAITPAGIAANDLDSIGGAAPDNGDVTAVAGSEKSGFGIPEYSKDSTNAELHSIAKEYGVDVAPNANKAELLRALDDFFADALPDEDTE